MLTAPPRAVAPRPGWARVPLPWVAAVLLVVVLVALRIQTIAERHLEGEAGRIATTWALQASRVPPGMPHPFAPAPPAADGPEALASLPQMTGVQGVRLYRADGRLLLEDPLAPSAARPATARDVAVATAPRVELLRADRSTGRTFGAQVWTPVRDGGRVLGVAELRIDLAEIAAATTRSALASAVAALVGLVAIGALGFAMWRVGLQRERQAHERMAYLDEHDPLTGALNRSSFLTALAAADSARGGAVLCLDLDRFRELNDWLGRSTGDALLRQIAARLRATVRAGDLVARLGSDEFALLALGADADAAAALAQRVVEAVGRPCSIAGRRIEIGASIGIAVRDADTTPDALVQRADLALARAKSDGRGSYRFYEARLDDDLQLRRQLSVELRDALAQRRLVLHYQPLHDAVDGHVVGYEALARWPHPERGFVPPSEFIPLAEQIGVIDALGRWVLETACEQAAAWPAPLRIAVNLSPAQFGFDGSIVDTVAAVLARTGLAPQRLELEITESLLMSRTEPVLAALHALRASGVRVAMDDFGTGYSSLAHLWRFPFDKVKLDREFTNQLGAGVGDPKVGVIVSSVVSMAHALGMSVTAEGVETEDQRAALSAHGCDELQGYFLGRPQAAGQLRHDHAVASPDRATARAAFASEV